MGTTNIIYIYGASGHGKVVADIAMLCGYEVAGFVDDREMQNAISFEKFLEKKEHCRIALGIGSNKARERIYAKLKSHGLGALTLIHPSAIIAQSARIGEGTVIMAGSIINCDAAVAKGAIINTGSIIEHDNRIGEFAHISPGAALAGDVTVHDLAHIGIGASVIQGITVGEHAVVGAGSTVIRDVPAHATVAGSPAKAILHV